MGKLSLLTIAFAFGVLTQVDAQHYKVIYAFGTHPGDQPLGYTISQSPAGYLLGSAGDLDKGIAFEISTSGEFKAVHAFTGSDGDAPASGLMLGTDQRFHGTTVGGGKYGFGTVFRLRPGGKITIEHSFRGGTDGDYPFSVPIQSIGGDFYGVTSDEFSFRGSVYRISASSHEYRLLHTFSGPDGSNPLGALVQGSDGRFYGTARNGGNYGSGTIFRVSANGAFKVLHKFDDTHGRSPSGPLIQASDGYFYGLAALGGELYSGVAFRMTPAGSLTVIHTFNGDDGEDENGGLVEATDGNFYGTSLSGGAQGAGTLFRLTPTGEVTKLHDFDYSTGYSPTGALIQHTNGKLYGTAYSGGKTSDAGVMFEYDLGLHPFVTYLPVYGRAGARVVILGQDFENNSIVSFNGVPAREVEIHPTYIKAFVPDGATTGYITVATSKGGKSLLLKSNKIFVIH